jgi:hypothetical protein
MKIAKALRRIPFCNATCRLGQTNVAPITSHCVGVFTPLPMGTFREKIMIPTQVTDFMVK